jgi:hypothetical protein
MNVENIKKRVANKKGVEYVPPVKPLKEKKVVEKKDNLTDKIKRAQQKHKDNK